MALREMSSFDPDALGPAQSYSSRPRAETPGAVLRNRVGMTSVLLGIAMGASYLLGRRSD